MKFRELLVAGLCLAALGGIALPMAANAQAGVYFNTALPPARSQVAPAARRGYIWVPGYWNARGNRHVWHSGHWERSRPGYNYVQPNWVERDNRWQFNRVAGTAANVTATVTAYATSGIARQAIRTVSSTPHSPH